jgi:hypothetical protein
MVVCSASTVANQTRLFAGGLHDLVERRGLDSQWPLR